MYSQKQGYCKGTKIVKWFKEFNNNEMVHHECYYKGTKILKWIKKFNNNKLVHHERYNKLGHRIYMWVSDGDNKSHTQIERKYKNYLLVKLYKNTKLVEYHIFNLTDGNEIFSDIKHTKLIKEIISNDGIFKYNSLIAHRFFMYKFEFMFERYLNQLTNTQILKMKLLVGAVLIGIMNEFEHDLNIRKIKLYGKDIVIKAINHFKYKLDYEFSEIDNITMDFIVSYQF